MHRLKRGESECKRERERERRTVVAFLRMFARVAKKMCIPALLLKRGGWGGGEREDTLGGA